jgi:hypothetical protein
MRPGHPFYYAPLLESELDPNLNCFWPPPRGLEPDQPWTSFLSWKTLLDSIFFNPCTTHGHKHGCHVRIRYSNLRFTQSLHSMQRFEFPLVYHLLRTPRRHTYRSIKFRWTHCENPRFGVGRPSPVRPGGHHRSDR